jgi:hypothetical protein
MSVVDESIAEVSSELEGRLDDSKARFRDRFR